MAWQQPKTNWDTHPKAIEPEDLNRIEGNIKVVRETVDIPLRMEVVDSFPPHTAGRMVYHSGNKKAYISDGSRWVPIGIEGDAEAKHVLEGKTFSSQVAGAGAVGSMPDRGAVIITPGSSDIPIAEGYHNGQGFVVGDENFVAGNLLKSQSFFGVEGTSTNIPIKEGTIRLAGKASGSWIEASTDTSYRSVSTIKLGNLKGRAIIHICIKTSDGMGRAFSRLYKNGEPYGVEKFTGSTSGYEYSELVDVNPNDTFELYMKTSSHSYPCYFNRFEMCINMSLTKLVK